MFGYVKACKSELKVKEYDLYSAAYCGTCRAMGKCTGVLSRFSLNYDFVFLSLVRSVLAREKLSVSSHRCIAHPLKKRPMLDPSSSFRYSARASAVLSAFKLEDDVADSRRFSRLAHVALLPFFKHFKRKADLDSLGLKIKEKLDLLSALEAQRCPSVDRPAELFGELLGEVFCYGLEGETSNIAYAVGFHTGKFVYAADAADDYLSDLKSGSYNPLCEIWGSDFDDNRKANIEAALLCELHELEAAIDRIDFSGYCDVEAIIKNIIYLGMPEQMHKALYNNSERNDRI